jgi:hypothetical protein
MRFAGCRWTYSLRQIVKADCSAAFVWCAFFMNWYLTGNVCRRTLENATIGPFSSHRETSDSSIVRTCL